MQYRPRGEARLEALELARLGTRRTAVSSESLGVQLPRPLRLTWGQNVTRRVLIWVRIKGLVRRRLRNFRSGGETTSVIINILMIRMKKKRETETGFDIDIAPRRCAEEEQTLRRRSVHFRSMLQVYGEQRGREEEKGLGLFVNIRLV